MRHPHMKWKTVPLEQLAAHEDGAIKIGPFGSQLKKCDLVSTGIHVVGIENVLQEKFDGLGERYITAEKFQSLKSVEVRPGDLLITMMGTVGEVAIVAPGTRTSVMDSHLLRFRPNLEVCEPRFVAWLLKGSPVVRAAVQGRAHGAIMKGLNSSLIRTLPAPLPPLAEQERIVKLLDEADELRKLRAQTDRRTAALLPALFHEMFGDPRANSRAHRVVTLGSLCQKISDGTHKTPTYVSSGVPFVTVKNITTGQLDFSETKFISEKEHLELTKRTKPERGDVLVSKDGTIGVPCNVDTDREFSIFVSIALLKLRRELANSVFLTGQLNTDWVQAQIREGTKGIAIRHLHLRDFRTLKIILPPLPLQNEFAQRVTEIRELEAAQAASRQRLDALFQSMLHRAFQGDL